MGMGPAGKAIAGGIGMGPAGKACFGGIGIGPAGKACAGGIGIGPAGKACVGGIGIGPAGKAFAVQAVTTRSPRKKTLRIFNVLVLMENSPGGDNPP
jgi:hypothetical protein